MVKKSSLSAVDTGPDSFAQLFSTKEVSTVLLQRNSDVTASCRKVLASAFADQSSTKTAISVPLGPLPKLHVSTQFAHDQLWHQLELRNKRLLSILNHAVLVPPKTLEEPPAQTSLPKRMVTFAPSPSSSEKEVGMSQPRIHKNKKHKLVQQSQLQQNSDASRPQKSSFRSEDGFFSLTDMEAFANDAELLAEQGKLFTSDDDDSQNRSHSSSSDEDDEPKQFYADFFDHPQQATLNADAAAGNRAAILLNEADGSSEEEEGDGDGDGGYNDQRQSVDEDEQEQGEVEDGSEVNDGQRHLHRGAFETTLTPLEQSRQKTRTTIEAIEDASVQSKPWALRGEVSAFSRPKDSLLQTEVQHDISARSSAYVDTETNRSIEELIKQRILDGLFDDVTLAMPEHYHSNQKNKFSRNELPEISQDRPAEGLAELYAREFAEEKAQAKKQVQTSVSVQRVEDETETEDQREVNEMFDKLARKLNSLSSLRYMPTGDVVKPEILVSQNVKSISAEDAVPDSVSGGDILAPHEVYTADKNSAKGEIELTKLERKAKRRANKIRQKKSKEVDGVQEKSMAHYNAKAVDKRRADAAPHQRKSNKRYRASSASDSGLSALGAREVKLLAHSSLEEDGGKVQAASQLVL